MRGEKGIRELYELLRRMVNFIEEFGTEEESESEKLDFANDVLDTLSWIILDLSNKEFSEDPYLDMPRLKEIVRNIEERTGKKLDDYQVT